MNNDKIQDQYKDAEDNVYNILLDQEDEPHFPTLYVVNNQLTFIETSEGEEIDFQDAIDRFGAHTVGEVCRLNLENEKLNELLDELDELEKELDIKE